jgi:hypothetical protein
MQISQNQVLSYREMCDLENKQTLQRGMNYRLNPAYSVLLMSQRPNAPYTDKIYSNGVTIEYEGHDVSKRGYNHNPKSEDQLYILPSGTLTQNGLFAKAIDDSKQGLRATELVKVYEKIMAGIWSIKGCFNLVDYKVVMNSNRKVYRFILQLSDNQQAIALDLEQSLPHNRMISSEVKKEVWKRDKGQCVICGAIINLHFDHDLPYSKGGTSLSAENVRLLCIKHNLEKSAKIQ